MKIPEIIIKIIFIPNQIQITVIITRVAGFASSAIAIVDIDDVSESLLQIVLEKLFVIEVADTELLGPVDAVAAVAVADARVERAQSAIFNIIIVVAIFGLVEDEFLLPEHNRTFIAQTRTQSRVELAFVRKLNETIALRSLRFLVHDDFEADDAFVPFEKVFFYHVVRNRFVDVPHEQL